MKTIVAPIHLDAMLLSHHTVVKEAFANYTLLPYTDKTQDYNPDRPYLGEAILNHPFQDENLLLKAGVHLHWSLPKGLSKTVGIPLVRKDDLNSLASFFPEDVSGNSTKWGNVVDIIWQSVLLASGWIKLIKDNGNMASIMEMTVVDKDQFHEGMEKVKIAGNLTDTDVFIRELKRLIAKPLGADYPAVPNVWLITRKENAKTKIELAWIVESNFISTSQTKTKGNIGSVNIPFHDDNHDNKSKPFRYLGRQRSLDKSWKLNQSDREHFINEVTAVGYNPQKGSKGFGEPTFAAFYPNCLSVFGFYDPKPEPNRTYEVMGIYSDNESDYFKNFLKDFYNRYQNDGNFFDKLNEVVKNEFQWEIDKNSSITISRDDTVPERTILFGKATPKTTNVPKPKDIDIAVGNTGTEALSAYLASKINGDKNINEEILESIQFASKLQNQVLDIGHKFEEARHDKGFTAFEGGTIWSLKLETINDGKTPPQNAKKNSEAGEEKLSYTNEIAVLLNEVNKLQFDFDKKLRETPFLRRQLFSDWYKYMLSSYPSVDNTTFHFDSDELLNYIRKNSIKPLQENLDQLGTVSIAKDEQGRFKDVLAIGEKNSLATRLAKKLTKLKTMVDSFNNQKQADKKSWKEKGKCLAIRQGSAPRYWRANDPVILFAEKPGANQQAALTNDRYKDPINADPIICNIIDTPDTDFSKINTPQLDNIYQEVSKIYSNQKDTNLGQSDKIWNPFMMEWEVEFVPARPKSNHGTSDHKYDPEYVNSHYQLGETDPDFKLKSSVNDFQNASIYIGSTILTPSAGISLDRTIDQFIEDHGDAQSEDNNTLDSLKKAQAYLKKINVLSQSLGGFHEALVMQQQTRQLDIADPLGFPEYQSFAKNEVAPLVEKFNLTAPVPLGVYNPIRIGVMNMLSLRLIDTFGQTIDFESSYFDDNNNNVVTAETVTLGKLHSGFHLKPRLSQPARINFRLLSGISDEEEMNDDPVSSPICGWLMPNHLDRSIMIYDHDGSAIGALTLNATYPWAPSPGGGTKTNIGSIKNPHLRRVVTYLMDRQVESIESLETTDNSFLFCFLKALDSAFENIDPENFAEHQDLAVLMGRPVAVFRTKLNLELENPPTTDQSWTQLHHEILGQGRTSDDFTKVKFPIRLGEHQQLNDGLVGYWIENKDGTLGQNYYSSEASESLNTHIKTYHTNNPEPLNIFQSLDDDPINVTMLADPRGTIQAITGILPIKSLSIPNDQYKDALRKISNTFLTAPVLSPSNHLKIGLPKEAGYEWSWLERSKEGNWSEIPQTVIIDKSVLDSKFPDEPTLWNRLVTKNWLDPLAENPARALITSAVHRAFPPNQETGETDRFPIDLGKRIDEFFDAYGKRIEPFDLQAGFSGPQTIREGWLKLGKVK